MNNYEISQKNQWDIREDELDEFDESLLDYEFPDMELEQREGGGEGEVVVAAKPEGGDKGGAAEKK
jgi:hypothetical protein